MMAKEIRACVAIANLARPVSGRVSVGLNALAVVKPMYS